MISDPICALATPKGIGAIAVIRVSGKEVFPIVEKIFSRQLAPATFPALIKGKIIDPEKKELVDEVVLAVYRSPNSYTGEDMVEIFAHGGLYCPEKIISLLVRYGCRPSYPGEFTKRRFLAGKIDLTQAEALLSLISAQTELQAKTAMSQMQGNLHRRIREIAEDLKDLLAEVEHTIEFDEENKNFTPSLQEMEAKVKNLIENGEKGVLLSKGITCPIVGRVNVGKSSLFNRLLGKERALVTKIPGTTRDAIEETTDIGSLPFRLIDTCGWRVRKGKLEALGWEKTKDYLSLADLVIVVLDHSRPLTEEDREILKTTADKKRIVVKNKCDRRGRWQKDDHRLKEVSGQILEISCREGTGIEELKEEMKKQFLNGETDFCLSEIRHLELLKKVQTALEKARATKYLEGIAYELKSAINALGEITGAGVNEEILERIFSRFCVGK